MKVSYVLSAVFSSLSLVSSAPIEDTDDKIFLRFEPVCNTAKSQRICGNGVAKCPRPGYIASSVPLCRTDCICVVMWS
ncbi:hypothetical protein BB8028_0004g06180 [Beauveria bassiana]|uniref:Uncharacterized protein n=1 Tax=Beauveria bassiana TaxID=176275 RepID=A0A2S7YC55_BEABA|nr:hypothetical protein BB8028_0004g06180 [Beauveria bassiana]